MLVRLPLAFFTDPMRDYTFIAMDITTGMRTQKLCDGSGHWTQSSECTYNRIDRARDWLLEIDGFGSGEVKVSCLVLLREYRSEEDLSTVSA